MTRESERLAALAAGDELSARERRRLERELSSDVALGTLTKELREQREWLLALRDEPLAGENVYGTIRTLRARISEDRVRRWPFGGWLLPAGAGAVLLLAALLGWHRMEGRLATPVPLPAVAAVVPDSPVLRPAERRQRRPELRAPKPALAASTSSVVKTATRSSAAKPHALQPAMDRVEEMVGQADGTVRLKLSTRNPNVVIYLVQGEPIATDALEETNGVGGE